MTPEEVTFAPDGFSYTVLNGLTFLTCDELTRLGITHGFTTRTGGVSGAPYDSLNLSFSEKRFDSAGNVRENYNRVLSSLGYTRERAIITNQTHTNTVYVCNEQMCGTGFARAGFPEGVDGLVSNLDNTLLAVTVADCVPILLYDRNSGAIGAVHSGWAGTAGEISTRALEKMNAAYKTLPENTVAVIGASIGVCCYEVGHDFFERFVGIFGDFCRDCFTARDEKYMFDISRMCEKILLRSGIREKNLFSARICTFCRDDLFFSYRRQRAQRGSMAGIIAKP